MASNKNNSNSNRLVVPEAQEAMNKFKMEAANEVGVNLKEGYNGHLTSREAGSVGGQMVKKMCPGRMFEFIRKLRSCTGHEMKVQYIVSLIA